MISAGDKEKIIQKAKDNEKLVLVTMFGEAHHWVARNLTHVVAKFDKDFPHLIVLYEEGVTLQHIGYVDLNVVDDSKTVYSFIEFGRFLISLSIE